MNKYNVLYTSDSNFFSHMVTSIYSLLENNKNFNIVIHIIEKGFTISQKRILYEILNNYNVDIKLYHIDNLKDVIDKYNIPKWRETDIANARLFAGEIIKNVDRLLYIDSDTIIVNSIEELFNRKINYPIGAVKELFIPPHMEGVLSKYYNSGVILFDYNMWENEKCMDLIYNCLQKNRDRLFYPDQDLLNMSLKDRIDTLSMNYNLPSFVYEILKYPFLAKRYFDKNNVSYKYDEVSDIVDRTVIFHMLEYFYVKPWEENSVHPFNEVYLEYRTLWDKNFKASDNDTLIAKVKFLSFINCCLKSLLVKEDFDEIKKFFKIYKGP